MDERIEYTWVLCPNCGRKFFRHKQPKEFNIEIACPACKGTWKVYSTAGGGVGFEQIRPPVRVYKPRETKEDPS